MSDCNSITPNLAVPEPDCLGKYDEILMDDIDVDPYCLNNRCYKKETLMSLENGRDPFSRAVFTMNADDDFQPPNPEAISRLQSRQWGYAPTVQEVLERAEAQLDFPIPRADEPYEGSLLQLRDNAFRTWIWQLLDAVRSFFDIDATLSEANITDEQKQAFLDLGDDLINNRVPYSVLTAFNLPKFPDPDEMLADGDAAGPQLSPIPYATQPLQRNSEVDEAWDPEIVATTQSPEFDPMDIEENSEVDEAWDPAIVATTQSPEFAPMDIDANSDEMQVADQLMESQANVVADQIAQNLDDSNEDPLAQFDSFFESDNDSPRRRRRNQPFEPWERRR